MSPCVNGTGVCTSPSAPYPGYVPPPGALGTLGWGLSREKYGSSVAAHLGEAEGGQGIAPSMGLSLVFFLELSPFPLFASTQTVRALGQSDQGPLLVLATSISPMDSTNTYTVLAPRPCGAHHLVQFCAFLLCTFDLQCVLEPFL